MRLYASPKRALRPTLRKRQASQPQSNRTKTGRRLELGRRPDLRLLLLSGVGVSGVPKHPAPVLLHAPIHRSAWKGYSQKLGKSQRSTRLRLFFRGPIHQSAWKERSQKLNFRFMEFSEDHTLHSHGPSL